MFVNNKPFPKCAVKCENDKGFVSEEQYICILASAKFPEEIDIRLLYPYWEQNDEDGIIEDFYSWSDRHGNVFSHFEKGHNESLSVIDWFSVNDNDSKTAIFIDYFKKAKEYSRLKNKQ